MLNQWTRGGAIVAALLLLAACSDGSNEEGIEITLKAVPVGTAAHHHDDAATTAAAKSEEVLSFRRSDGTRIDLQLGLVNLVPIELVRCETSTAALLLDYARQLSPIGSAVAHGDEGGEAPEGSVSVAVEATRLGTLVAKPGEYCKLIVELQPGTEDKSLAKHGGELDTSMDGASVNVAPCYYPGTSGLSDDEAAAATAHHCVQTKFTGSARRVTLPLVDPVTLDSTHRELELTVALRYEEWFESIDFETLTTDVAQQAKLADNVAASMQAVSDEEQLVNLAFAIEVGGEEATCGTIYEGLGSTAQPLRLEGFRFYASDFELVNASTTVSVVLATKPNATVYQDDAHGVALLGHAQGCDNTTPLRNLALTGTAPAGDYDQLCFTLGVPSVLNHTDVATAPSPLNVTALSWGWLYGRQFLRVDTLVQNPDSDSEDFSQNFFVHLGSTGCSNGSDSFDAAPDSECVYPNRPRICLNYDEIAEGHRIVADIAPVIAEADITYNTPDTAPGCMSFPGDPECTTILPRLGLDFALAPDNLIPRQEQTLFSVGE